MDNISEEEVYDVESIVDDRMYKGKKQYLIKWEGYPDSDNTWEFEDNLMCDDILKEYLRKKKETEILKQQEKLSSVKTSTGPVKTSTATTSEPAKVPKTVPVSEQPKSQQEQPSKSRQEQPSKLQPATNTANQADNKFFKPTNPGITNEWNDYIQKVTGAFLNGKGEIEIEFILKDGLKGTALSSEVRVKAPLKLLDFYEENLSFPE